MSYSEVKNFEHTLSLPNRDFRHYRKMLIINLNNKNDEALIQKHSAKPFDRNQPILEWNFEDGTKVTLQLKSDDQEYWGEVRLITSDGIEFKGNPLGKLTKQFIQEVVIDKVRRRYICIFDPIGMVLFD
ncbi:MAG: hypothetical protein GX775_04505 [Erysipelothrix sp.]|nr:hypothetical protein [Erysipelothrix sp.]